MSKVDRPKYKSEHHHGKPRRKLTAFQRLGICIMAFMLAGFGIGTLLKGHTSYPNWWGGPVFAPVAIVGAVLLLIWAFHPDNSAHS